MNIYSLLYIFLNLKIRNKRKQKKKNFNFEDQEEWKNRWGGKEIFRKKYLKKK